MKPTLIIEAVKVGWRLESVADPEIIEKTDATTKIRLLSYMGEHQYGIDLKEKIAVFNSEVDIPDNVANNLGHRILYLTFIDVDHCELINPDPFTRNKVLFDYPIVYADLLLQNYDSEIFNNQSALKWEVEKICIDPNFYEVTNSPLVTPFTSDLRRKHWIIVGHDELLSITATRFEVKELSLDETGNEMRWQM